MTGDRSSIGAGMSQWDRYLYLYPILCRIGPTKGNGVGGGTLKLTSDKEGRGRRGRRGRRRGGGGGGGRPY